MESGLFKFIFKHSWRQQVWLLVLTAASFPFLYMSFDLPKTIVNKAINGKDFPKDVWGFHFEQISYLMVLCGIYLLLTLVNGGFKYWINTSKGRLGERMLRRMRYELFSRVLRFPLPAFKRVGQGEVISMINAEVEPLGGFIGDAWTQPAQQGGTLLTIVVFMFIQDWILGLAAISLYPIQAIITPRLQKKVRQLQRQRKEHIRRVAEKIGEAMSGAADIRAHGASTYKRAEFSHVLGEIYEVRYELYQRKFFIKFINNFINTLTPIAFYAIGGVLVIYHELSFGALVAALAAYKDMSAPWRELLAYYQQKEDSRQSYEMVVERFTVDGMIEEQAEAEAAADVPPFDPKGQLAALNLTYAEDEITTPVENISFTAPLADHVAVVGPSGGGKEELGLLLARLIAPTGGRVEVSGQDLAKLPDIVLGRRVAYVGQGSALFNTTLRENLLYGLRHRPVHDATYDEKMQRQRVRQLEEAEASGNSPYDIHADWIDHAALGLESPDLLSDRIVDVLRTVDLDRDVYDIGLRSTIDPKKRPELAALALDARKTLRERLAEPKNAKLVEPFDESRYNRNATMAENLLFGTPVGPTFDMDRLRENPEALAYIRHVMQKADLTNDVLAMGREVAALMVDLFADLPPGHEFFDQYSFIKADDLPEYQAILQRVGPRTPVESLRPDDRFRLMGLPFRLIADRHRLGMPDEAFQQKILEARKVFAADLPDNLRHAVEFFDFEHYNTAASLLDNVLFGKVAYGQSRGPARVGALIAEVVDAIGMRRGVIDVGLDYPVGIAGARLGAGQRQKVAIARCLLKRPEVLVVNQATALLESAARNRTVDAVLKEMEGHGVVWILEDPALAEKFDRVLVIANGKVQEQGEYGDLKRSGGSFNQLVAAE